ncbi:MAG: A/G-specific adenine glycosylase [Proteobacteria bacterium]|nr:A/G-specific adenine glycosylase [Pseudomonadota bacterium]
MEEELSTVAKSDIVQPLLLWFLRTARDLPWRRTYDPYHVWISEIMLQQTQMDRGVVYFKRWIDRFPSVRAVAEADQQEILKYWEGLGYYARARNLHKAAKVIAGELGDQVPCDYKQLLTLPGVGPYTAAAIASVAGNHDVAVIDANVTRVYARLFDLDMPVKDSQTRKRIIDMAEYLLPHGRARHYNQALMDLGGLVCLPKNPRCLDCPLEYVCRARQAGTVAERPVIGPGKKIVTVNRVAGVIRHGERIFIQQRRPEAVWGGLWEFPGGELQNGAAEIEVVRHILAETGLGVRVVSPITTVTHHYTRYKIILLAFCCELLGRNTQAVLRSAVDFRWAVSAELKHYAFPAGPRKILEHMKTTSPSQSELQLFQDFR